MLPSFDLRRVYFSFLSLSLFSFARPGGVSSMSLCILCSICMLDQLQEPCSSNMLILYAELATDERTRTSWLSLRSSQKLYFSSTSNIICSDLPRRRRGRRKDKSPIACKRGNRSCRSSKCTSTANHDNKCECQSDIVVIPQRRRKK